MRRPLGRRLSEIEIAFEQQALVAAEAGGVEGIAQGAIGREQELRFDAGDGGGVLQRLDEMTE